MTDSLSGEPTPRFVRPYTLTGGRTEAVVDLPFEATLVLIPQVVDRLAANPESQRILGICDSRSVAEVSALTKMPIGVTRVLLGDLVQQGFVRVQSTITETTSKDERIDLIEWTLRGLRSY
jgi:hypothetical protein